MNFLKVVNFSDHTLKGLQVIDLQSFGVTQTFLMLHVFQNSSGTLKAKINRASVRKCSVTYSCLRMLTVVKHLL